MNLSSFRPAYLLRRLAQLHFARAHPDAPWLSESAVLLLDSFLKSTDVGIEWGAGRSTLWFAQRVANLYSIEDESHWYLATQKRLKAAGLASKVILRFIPCEFTETDDVVDHPYANAALAFEDGSLDFALVDGNIRSACLQIVTDKIAPGGLLVLDNANRFLPNRHGNAFTTVHEERMRPRTPIWNDLAHRLKTWRWINTTDGIWDTRMWIKPLAAPPLSRRTKRQVVWHHQE